jgi:hypothetical protein
VDTLAKKHKIRLGAGTTPTNLWWRLLVALGGPNSAEDEQNQEDVATMALGLNRGMSRAAVANLNGRARISCTSVIPGGIVV